MQNQINHIVSPQARYIIQGGATVLAGVHAVNYQSPAGVLPIVGDFFINPATPYPYNTAGSSGAEGSTVSSIFLIQLNGLEMADLMPVGRTELNKQFLVKILLYRWILNGGINRLETLL